MQFIFFLFEVDVLVYSDQLVVVLCVEIFVQGGVMLFFCFMELCLYVFGWGYYSVGVSKFGGSGDFIIVFEFGSLFVGSVVNVLVLVFVQFCVQVCMLELGGGIGVFVEVVLLCLVELDVLLLCYVIFELSVDLCECQQQCLQQNLLVELVVCVEWIDCLFEEDWEGVVFVNEVIDVLLILCFLIWDGEVYEEIVEFDGEGNFICGVQLVDILFNGVVCYIECYLEKFFVDGYCFEVLLQLLYWLQVVVGGLQCGVMLFVDYGYSCSEFYQYDCDDGMVCVFYCYYVYNDVYCWLGLQDIIVLVDFIVMVEVGMYGGFELVGYCSQVSFLFGNGLDQVLLLVEECMDEVGCIQLCDQVKKLILLIEMGECFQVIGLQCGVDFEFVFELGDLSWCL